MAQLPNTLEGELKRRRLRSNYGEYVEYSNHGFYMTKFHRYLCDEVQGFLEHESDNANEKRGQRNERDKHKRKKG